MRDALTAGRAFLRASRNADGSWGFTPGQAGKAGATVLAAAAGAEPDWLARDWLAGNALSWGAFLLPAIAWARDPELCRPAVAAITSFESVPVPGLQGFDSTLPGWSWVPGTAAWVEPTAYAVLSLRRAGGSPERIAEGIALILDRQCDDGGWNYGNPDFYGTRLVSHVPDTAWALMALPAEPAHAAAIERGLAFVATALSHPSTLSMALGALACAAHGRDPVPYLERLAPRVGAEGARSRVDLTALACAALACHLEDWHALV